MTSYPANTLSAALLLATLLYVSSTVSDAGAIMTCNATMYTGMSIGGNSYRQLHVNGSAACCAACVADPECAAFVTGAGGSKECLLKNDLSNMHAKASNDCGIVRGSVPPPSPSPQPSPPPAPPSPAPPGAPQWELVDVSAAPVIGATHPDVVKHGIFSGFETGQYQRINETFYYTANELGMCTGVTWDLVTRAALWSAPSGAGPWTRLATLRNGSHMFTMCNGTKKATTPCKKLPSGCCAGTKANSNFVTWAPTLIHAPSSVNTSDKDVWNFFYSSNQNSHYRDQAFNGITWAVSTTDSMLGPYVDVVGKNNSALPPGAEGVVNVAVNGSHSFSAWKLRNGSWAGFKNNVPGAHSFSEQLMVPNGNPTIPGGSWKPAGPNLASGSDCNNGFCYGPENVLVTTMSTDGKFYLAVYDALTQPAEASMSTGAVCSGRGCNRIGIGYSTDGVTWKHSDMVTVQTPDLSPCGQIRTPLGMVAEPERCKGCYSVLWTGIEVGGPFRPVCHAIIRNVNE